MKYLNNKTSIIYLAKQLHLFILLKPMTNGWYLKNKQFNFRQLHNHINNLISKNVQYAFLISNMVSQFER
jgi:hypothetical protein